MQVVRNLQHLVVVPYRVPWSSPHSTPTSHTHLNLSSRPTRWIPTSSLPLAASATPFCNPAPSQVQQTLSCAIAQARPLAHLRQDDRISQYLTRPPTLSCLATTHRRTSHITPLPACRTHATRRPKSTFTRFTLHLPLPPPPWPRNATAEPTKRKVAILTTKPTDRADRPGKKTHPKVRRGPAHPPLLENRENQAWRARTWLTLLSAASSL